MEQVAFATPSQIAAHQRRKAFHSGIAEIVQQRQSLAKQKSLAQQESENLKDEHQSLLRTLSSLRIVVSAAKADAVATRAEINRLSAKLIEHQLAVAEIENSAALSVQMIARKVARYYAVSMADLLSARRTAVVVRPRQIAMYLAKTLTLRSLPDIGRRFGGRDHTTVLHAVRKIERLRPIDVELEADIRALLEILKPQEAPNVA